MRLEQLGLNCLNTEKIRTILVETNEKLAATAGNGNLAFKGRYHFSLAMGYCRLLAKTALNEKLPNPEMARLLRSLSRETPWLRLEEIQRAIFNLEALVVSDQPIYEDEVRWTIDFLARLNRSYAPLAWRPRRAVKNKKPRN